jgi:CRISPR-associated protein Cas2
MAHFLVAYDVVQSKRRVRVAKLVYSYALGGQKSALEVPTSSQEARELAEEIVKRIDEKTDRVNLIRVEEDAILLGRATQIEYNDGVILL